MSNYIPRRQPKGQPTGGQFAETAKASPGLSLGQDPHSGDPLRPSGDDSRQVRELAKIASRPDVSVAELNMLLSHDQPLVVRVAAARTPYPGVAEKASYDPSPYVRALALEGWDLSEESRSRLSADQGVMGLLSVVGQP
ncbi:hypothetical protein GCG21_13665 [Pseudactinotalea sp. HY160]|uniref:hypothetical protein n=1 Tax=Pseudactinotalea sp. HY160 TaxID=2654490 RepID=UPI00128D384F|nr:hypothetical protein [Pseudactinotalea sp. HY160]MPV51034.1 hypothetical protein [Pseudactinotalea sp. HY160]